ncbi:MAG: hypothetical protein ABI199_01610 [Bacteroidia bacterium]
MNYSIERLNKLMEGIPSKDPAEQLQALANNQTALAEALAFGSVEEIEALIREIEKDFNKSFETPFWIKIVALRILVSNQPNNKEYREWLNNTMSLYGAGWEKEVENW